MVNVTELRSGTVFSSFATSDAEALEVKKAPEDKEDI